jgi:hypothetical protein
MSDSFQSHIIEPLSPSKHHREEFDCGVPALNDFLRTRARKEMEAGTSMCFVMVPEDTPGRIVGYYTLSAAMVERTDLPEAMIKKLPRYDAMPATLLGRLARERKGTKHRPTIDAQRHQPFRISLEGGRLTRDHHRSQGCEGSGVLRDVRLPAAHTSKDVSDHEGGRSPA